MSETSLFHMPRSALRGMRSAAHALDNPRMEHVVMRLVPHGIVSRRFERSRPGSSDRWTGERLRQLVGCIGAAAPCADEPHG